MGYELRFSREFMDQVKELRAFDKKRVMERIREVLTVNPDLESKATVKRLRQPAIGQYRLRVGEYRVYYHIEKGIVYVLGVERKAPGIYEEA